MRSIPCLSENDINRFWSKVAITADVEKCWNWTGYIRHKDRTHKYGCINLKKDGEYKPFVAPRVSYFISNGIDPLQNIILHKCDNPSCVNPNHLLLGTSKDNSKDMISKGRGKNQFVNG